MPSSRESRPRHEQATGSERRPEEVRRRDALPKADRALLNDWLQRNTTGAALIRAGVPAGWKVGDETDAGDYGTRNDIAVVRAPHRAPIVLAILSSRTAQNATYDNALIAKATKVVMSALTWGAFERPSSAPGV
ncbi:MAG TPA: serine hydrolase [Actinomadura sp.]|nr:serine hydrolase [Actinomadura sp.]